MLVTKEAEKSPAASGGERDDKLKSRNNKQ